MRLIGSTTDLDVPPGLASSLSFLQEMDGRGSGSRSQKVLPHPYIPPTRFPWPGLRSGAGLTDETLMGEGGEGDRGALTADR